MNLSSSFDILYFLLYFLDKSFLSSLNIHMKSAAVKMFLIKSKTELITMGLMLFMYFSTLLILRFGVEASVYQAKMLACTCLLFAIMPLFYILIPRYRRNIINGLCTLTVIAFLILYSLLICHRNVVYRVNCDVDNKMITIPTTTFSYVIILYGAKRNEVLQQYKNDDKYKLFTNNEDADGLIEQMTKNPTGSFTGYVYKHICESDYDVDKLKQYKNVIELSKVK